MKPLEELMAVDDPAWPELAEAIEDSPTATPLPPTEQASADLHAMQVTTASTMGALIAHTGGVLTDHGWIRLLGGGGGPMPGIVELNGIGTESPNAGFVVIATDALGGRFAANGGALPGPLGGVCHFGADTLEWLDLGVGHSDFVHWALAGDHESFWHELRWPGWQTEISALAPHEGLAIWPPVFAEESRPLETTSRTAVPWEELAQFAEEAASQLER